MSGGSMDYLYNKIQQDADFCKYDSDMSSKSTMLRQQFRKVLDEVIVALHDIEWVDSGDYSPGDEHNAINQVFITAAAQLSTRELQDIVAKRLRTVAAPVVDEKWTMKPLADSSGDEDQELKRKEFWADWTCADGHKRDEQGDDCCDCATLWGKH